MSWKEIEVKKEVIENGRELGEGKTGGEELNG